MRLCFGMGDLEIRRYTKANFAGHSDDTNSTSGYMFLFGRMIIS